MGSAQRRRAFAPAAPHLLVARARAMGVIAAVGTLAYVASTLPPIQSLEVPKRPPTVQIVGLDGRPLATRGEMGGTDVPLKELPPYLPKAFVAIEDRRFYRHFGVDPIGLRARRRRQRAAPRRVAGRLDHHPAARQEPVPDPGPHHLPQAAGSWCWRSGSSASSARTRSSSSTSTASISAPAPMASRRRRSAISASPRDR